MTRIVFWNMTTCTLLVTFLRNLKPPPSLLQPENHPIRFLPNSDTYLSHYTASHARRHQSEELHHKKSLIQNYMVIILFDNYRLLLLVGWGTRLRHSATCRKVAGSTPDGVIGIFYWHNTSSRTMALGSTQPLTEMSTRNIYWGVKAVGE